MYWLKIRIVLAVTGAGRKTQTSNAAAGNISKDIAMFVRENYYIQRLWRRNQTSRQIIDKKLLVTQAGICMYGFLYNRT